MALRRGFEREKDRERGKEKALERLFFIKDASGSTLDDNLTLLEVVGEGDGCVFYWCCCSVLAAWGKYICKRALIIIFVLFCFFFSTKRSCSMWSKNKLN